MAVSERVQTLMTNLAQAAEGRRQLPVVRSGDAAAVCAVIHEQVDRGTAERARTVESEGHTVACQSGCNHCCVVHVTVLAPEAVAIAHWLTQPEQSETRAHFLARFPAWHAQLFDVLQEWTAAVRAGDGEGELRSSRTIRRRQVMCAFNHEGRCSIYPVRPNVCRYHHAIDTSENCRVEANKPVQKRLFPPLEDYLERIDPLLTAMHAALGAARHDEQSLCVAVHHALAAPSGGAKPDAPGRNEPCRCGSGKKFKRCCGAG